MEWEQNRGISMRIMRKIKSRKGFSIGELLVATLILLMVSSVVAGGIPVARDAYTKVTVSANAQVLLSTSITALRNELGTASDVSASDNVVTYTSAKTGGICQMSLDGTNGIKITDMGFEDIGLSSDKTRQLVPVAAGPDDLYITYDSVSADSDTGIVSFTNLTARRKSDTTGSVKLATLQIRVVRDAVSS